MPPEWPVALPRCQGSQWQPKLRRMSAAARPTIAEAQKKRCGRLAGRGRGRSPHSISRSDADTDNHAFKAPANVTAPILTAPMMNMYSEGPLTLTPLCRRVDPGLASSSMCPVPGDTKQRTILDAQHQADLFGSSLLESRL